MLWRPSSHDGADALQTASGPYLAQLVQLCPRKGGRRLLYIAAGALNIDRIDLRVHGLRWGMVAAAALGDRLLGLGLRSRDAVPASSDPISVAPALVEPATGTS